MARIDWIETRLQNWARWSLHRGGGRLGYAAVQLGGPLSSASTARYRESVIPTDAAEASETDDAIGRLNPPGLALAVREVYLGRGGVADKCRRLCIAESTLHARITEAHRQLAAEFLAKRAAAEAERSRVEGLQIEARPGGGSFTP